MDRRIFFKVSAVNGGGLLLSTFIPFACEVAPEEPLTWTPNFFLRIGSDNTVTFICSQSEIGQGTSTGLAMIAADELGAKMEDISIEFAVGSEERYGILQDTGGSNGIRLLWEPLRESVAMAREMLIAAAAQKWEVPTTDCFSNDGMIRNRKTNQEVPFGELVELASTLAAPREVSLKDKKDYKYIGQPVIGPKTYQAAEGITPYSINVKVPDMLYAVIERCPVWGGSLVSFDATKAKAIPGVFDVIEIEPIALDPRMDYKGGVRAGVAVLANNTWAAMEGKKALTIEWEDGPNGQKSDEDMSRELALSKKQTTEVSQGFNDAARLIKKGKRYLEAAYEIPFEANACMEPLNATADYRGNTIEIWAGTQAPQLTRERISELTKLPMAAITVHNQPSGGGFGRRYFCDFVEEAVVLSEKVRRPVKVTWTREDTISTSKYHPLRNEYWEAALDDQNYPIALSYKGVLTRPSGYRPYPYSLPTLFHKGLRYKEGNLIPRASWRSVFAHHWGMGLECFMDELAVEAGIDPVQFRLDLLEQASIVEQKELPWVGSDLYPKKLYETLRVVAEKANWNKPNANGVFQGVSVMGYNTSYCSQIADISIENNEVKVHKVTVAIDCGLVINPSQVKNQVEGSVMWGLGAVLKPAITVKNGRVQQKNFDTYDLLRMKEAPAVEVHLIESDGPPTGTGEPVVPGVAPAILNAVYAATGHRIRKLPIGDSLQQLAMLR